MVESVLLIDGKGVDEEKVGHLSLANAKQLVFGRFAGTGLVVHVAATTQADLQKVILQFAAVKGVTGVITLAIRS